MIAKGDRFYFSIIAFLSILIATFIKLYLRPHYLGNNYFYKTLLGSLTNFFYVLGSTFIYPLFKNSISFKQYLNAVFFITLAAIVYEIDQLWTTTRTFDYLDIIATILAAILSVVIFKLLIKTSLRKPSSTIS